MKLPNHIKAYKISTGQEGLIIKNELNGKCLLTNSPSKGRILEIIENLHSGIGWDQNTNQDLLGDEHFFPVKIDYKELLTKYISHVTSWEHHHSAVEFTNEEIEELERLA